MPVLHRHFHSETHILFSLQSLGRKLGTEQGCRYCGVAVRKGVGDTETLSMPGRPDPKNTQCEMPITLMHPQTNPRHESSASNAESTRQSSRQSAGPVGSEMRIHAQGLWDPHSMNTNSPHKALYGPNKALCGSYNALYAIHGSHGAIYGPYKALYGPYKALCDPYKTF